jgi:D-2-hydroxyacid dehydrogenase (NADP+)
VSAAQLIERPEWLAEAEILYTHHVPAERVASAQNLKWVQTLGAGVEWLLTPEVRRREDLIVTNTSGIHAQPIAEHVFGFVLMFAHQLHRALRQQLAHDWDSNTLRNEVTTLSGATLGIVGLGAIGRRIAEIASAFGMRVTAFTRSTSGASRVERLFGPGQLVPFLKEAEYVINTLPLTAQTRGLFGAAEFAAMRSDAIFVNIGRGATVRTDALVDALKNGRIAGAALDVTDPEPLPPEHALWSLENVILTPHYSGSHPGYVQRASAIFLENLVSCLSGQPLTHVVDKHAGY